MARLGVPAGVVRHTIHYDVIDPDYPVGARSTTQPHPAQHAPFQCQAENADATLEPILRAGEAGRSMAGESEDYSEYGSAEYASNTIGC